MSTAPERVGQGLPAMFGGTRLFPEGLAFARPAVPDPDEIMEGVRAILESRMLTNAGYVRELERAAAEYLGVRHCVAVSSCTTGLMLLLRAADLSGDVVLPSFTFVATAHAVAWNGLLPMFADVDPDTLTLSAEAARAVIGVRTSAILATHTFGTPCDTEGLEEVAHPNGIRLFYDAAHGFGSIHDGKHVGCYGDAEVFSLSPTKVLVAGEGGIIATNDDLLAERCRIGRDYANPGDYDSRFVGLNGRMSEFHALIALHSLRDLDERIEQRNRIARRYVEEMRSIPGVSFPTVPDGDRSTFKDFTILVDPARFGMGGERLASALEAEGIATKRYYVPPVHLQRAYRSSPGATRKLPVTDAITGRVLTLPLWSEMSMYQVVGVAAAVRRIQRYAAGRWAREGVGGGHVPVTPTASIE